MRRAASTAARLVRARPCGAADRAAFRGQRFAPPRPPLRSPARCFAAAAGDNVDDVDGDVERRQHGPGLTPWTQYRAGAWGDMDTLVRRFEQRRPERQAAFGNKHSKPWRSLAGDDAWDRYLLTPRDLRGLPYIERCDLERFGHAGKMLRLYSTFDLQDAALDKHGSRGAMEAALEARAEKQARRVARLRPEGWKFPSLRPTLSKNGKRITGERAANAAIVGNAAVFLAKSGAFLATGSGAMLAATVHSAADVMNQLLLRLGLMRSTRPADDANPYGHGHETYVWAMISGVGSFFLGCGVTVYHGIHCLFAPEAVSNPEIALGVLAITFCLEAYTLAVAGSELRSAADAEGMSPWEYVRDGPDPVNVAVFLEDSVALCGVGVAAACISLAELTGNAVFDAFGSISIGLMMGGVACFLVNKNRVLLGGQVPRRTDSVVALLEADDIVGGVQDVKAVMYGPGVARFKAEILFNPYELSNRYLGKDDNLGAIYKECKQVESEKDAERMLSAYSRMLLVTLALEVDRLEGEIRRKHPEFKYIDLECL